jgi:hypothetical protein
LDPPLARIMMSDHSSNHPTALPGQSLPVRIITYAWGQRYLDELLTFTLPALLAPGNLPYVVQAATKCEVIILTEAQFFGRVLAHPVCERIWRLCPVRLIGLDDLIARDDAYGMSLTYALHRGFADLGPNAVDTWLMFLNADFILADDSLRTLVERLSRGQRLVASPSYCTVSGEVAPKLLKMVKGETQSLTVPKRELAALILRHRHQTIRAKTVNQSAFHHRYMDQFYWQLDSHTLLGYQMPVAIVGMRPERYLVEPNAFWDHGLMREFCPTSVPCVLGDSDEFLMLELREKSVAHDLITEGPLNPQIIAARMISWVTPYQREFAHFPLTLHDREPPADVDTARTQLRRVVDDVLSYCPDFLPSHLDHPQWNYHRVLFNETRHQFLSKKLGPLTETTAPPSSLFALDRVCWLLDGVEKAHARARAIILAGIEDHIAAIKEANSSEEERKQKRRELAARFIRELAPLLGSVAPDEAIYTAHQVDAADARESCCDRGGGETQPAAAIAEHYARWQEEVASLERNSAAEDARIHELTGAVKRLGQQRLQLLDAEFAPRRAALQRQYDAMVQRGADTAEIDVKLSRRGNSPVDQSRLRRWASALYRLSFGKLPRVTKLSPYWCDLRFLVEVVDAALTLGAMNVLVVGSASELTAGVADGFVGLRASVSVMGAMSRNLAKAFDKEPELDVVVCDLARTEFAEFFMLYHAVRPLTRSGGRIIAFYRQAELTSVPDPSHDLREHLLDSDAMQIHYGGTRRTARLAAEYRRVLSMNLPPQLRIPAALALAAPRCWLANSLHQQSSGAGCTSATIVVTVRRTD